MDTLQNGIEFAQTPADKVLFRKHVQRELDEIREEVAETCAVADDVCPVPESGYAETLSLLEQMHRSIPIPDIMWLEDGGIGLEWRPGDGIATMSLYGDGLVVYGAFFNKNREIAGVCSLADAAFLHGFLTTLTRLFQFHPPDRKERDHLARKLALASELVIIPSE